MFAERPLYVTWCRDWGAEGRGRLRLASRPFWEPDGRGAEVKVDLATCQPLSLELVILDSVFTF